jgi:hypothetical protein
MAFAAASIATSFEYTQGCPESALFARPGSSLTIGLWMVAATTCG